MSNSGSFLSAFNKIADYLRRMTKEKKETSFSALVTKASNSDHAVRRYATDLLEFNDLRNAIVHERTDSHVIAEPNDEAVRQIEHVVSVVTSPPEVYSLLKGNVLTLKINDSVADAVKATLDHSFSQIPIYENEKFVALLTTDTIARWLGACVKEDIFSLRETPLESVLKYTEEPDNYCFLGRNTTVFTALEKFHEYEQTGKRLEAMLITQNGKQMETLLGIITVWDLPRILEKLQK